MDDHNASQARDVSNERERSDDTPESDSTRLTTPKNGPETEKLDLPETDAEGEGNFSLVEFLREGHFERRVNNRSAKRIGVVYKNLTVKGPATAAAFVKTVPDAVVGTFGPDLYRLLSRFLPFLSIDRKAATRTLINDFTGVIRDGEMLLVLGRPGSGCSTFLKTLVNYRKHGENVTGQVVYGDISTKEEMDIYSGEINYNPEDDIHIAELNVWQTLTFALMNKTRKRNEGDISVVANGLMRMFGIDHTKYTHVGNELIPGVSGGERKRVSIAEALATKSAILCFDSPTRGLDADTALKFAKTLRTITDVSKKAIVTTLYQAGEDIYDQMDKVLVVEDGRCIFQGPAREAKQYFVDLGFHCPSAQTTADFLTSCADPGSRRFREGYADRAPKTAEELEDTFRKSQNYQNVLREVEAYEQELKVTDFASVKEFKESVQQAKSHRTPSTSPYTVSFQRQVLACFKREFWLYIGDTVGLQTKAFVIIAIGFIVGSLFYGSSLDSEGAFTRGGALFMSVLFLCWLQIAEVMKVISGRNVVAKHIEYTLYRPSAWTIARVLLDVVIILPQVTAFVIIMYFMCSLDVDGSKFWTYWLIVYANMLAITSLYRMFGSLSPTVDDAVRFASVALNLLIFYGGYVIPKPQLTGDYIWFGWINYVNPLAYAFEALEVNEFSDRNLTCAPSQLVPRQVPGGPPIDPAHQTCSLAGSPIDATNIPGPEYLKSTFGYESSHLWRNFGVVIAFTVLYILVAGFATEIFNFARDGAGVVMFARNKRSKKVLKTMASPKADDVEKGGLVEEGNDLTKQTGAEEVSTEKAVAQISKNQQIFTWEDVNYSVPVPGGQLQLLHNVDGYCKPGLMVALMGASGAGKTTLLNTLSQRQTMGVVSGDMLVDGRPPTSTFPRTTGFCAQSDLHDTTQTIREALEFSALLRQDRKIPRSEKIAYVDTIIDLLELQDSQDIVLSCLSLQQLRRLAIGMELTAKPSSLLFLDEPTSGLDSQSAYSIVQILRKLAVGGQAIFCTIHQPSSILIEQFDMILALNPGGNTFYFGSASTGDVRKYFADRGFECPPHKNIAEFLIETAAADSRRPDGSKINWNEEWKNSDNAKALKDEIHAINATRRQMPAQSEETQYDFAAPVTTQVIELTKRLFRQHWRDPSYFYGKLFTAVIMGIFNGFTFWKLGNTTVDMQNRMFSSFMIVTIPATVVSTVVPKFFQNMMLWMVREHPSRFYSWFTFVTAQILCEIPVAIVSSVLYWVLWYWPVFGTEGHSAEASTAGYVFFMTMLFYLFMASWGQWITAFAPSFTVIANILPLFFIMVSLFNGIMRPYSALPAVWKYTMYYVNPSTWWISGVLASVLHDLPIHCAEKEMIRFTPPAGQTCGEYASAFASAFGGNLTNPSATDVCNYCELTSGDQYLVSLSIDPDDKWRNCGIFCIFVVSNYVLVYFLMWSVRIKGWGFGMGYLFGFLGQIVGLVLSPFKWLMTRKQQ